MAYDIVNATETSTVEVSDNEILENVLFDMGDMEDSITIDCVGSKQYIRNVGFTGELQSDAPVVRVGDTNGRTTVIENVHFHDSLQGNRTSTERGICFWIAPEHNGTVIFRNCYFDAPGSTSVYGSPPGSNESGDRGEVVYENCYSVDAHNSAFQTSDFNTTIDGCVSNVTGSNTSESNCWVWESPDDGDHEALIKDSHFIQNGDAGGVKFTGEPNVTFENVQVSDMSNVPSNPNLTIDDASGESPDNSVPAGCPDSPTEASDNESGSVAPEIEAEPWDDDPYFQPHENQDDFDNVLFIYIDEPSDFHLEVEGELYQSNRDSAEYSHNIQIFESDGNWVANTSEPGDDTRICFFFNGDIVEYTAAPEDGSSSYLNYSLIEPDNWGDGSAPDPDPVTSSGDGFVVSITDIDNSIDIEEELDVSYKVRNASSVTQTQEMQFTVDEVSDALTVNTRSPSNIRGTSATLNGRLNTQQTTDTQVGFQYRESGQTNWQTIGLTERGTGNYSFTANDLEPTTGYDYRAYAESENALDVGSVESFTTSEDTTLDIDLDYANFNSPTDIYNVNNNHSGVAPYFENRDGDTVMVTTFGSDPKTQNAEYRFEEHGYSMPDTIRVKFDIYPDITPLEPDSTLRIFWLPLTNGTGSSGGDDTDGTNGWSNAIGFSNRNDSPGPDGFNFFSYSYHMDRTGSGDLEMTNEPVWINQWNTIEGYVKANTWSGSTPNNDGIMRYWVNGELAFERTGMNFTIDSNNLIEGTGPMGYIIGTDVQGDSLIYRNHSISIE